MTGPSFKTMIVGGLVIPKPDNGPLLQYAATTSFLSKLYSDYIDHLKISGATAKPMHSQFQCFVIFQALR